MENVKTPTMHEANSFLWHDYETFGAQTRRARPAQFAAIRTTLDLEPIGEPILLYCQPAPDVLPDPESCLITGITPQICQERGLSEAQFAQRIHDEFSQPGTIGVGYNSIRFDDEISRHLFWRNLLDPYGREWRNRCSRWDLLDVMRLCHALRPEALQWPQRPEGGTSFRLEDLTRANAIEHGAAHDALSDVRATLALAQRLRAAQPRLFDFALALRHKERVREELGLPCEPRDAKPFLHVSGMFGVERGCLALMWPLATHPQRRNELLAWDLAYDPNELVNLDPETARVRLFTKQSDLPEGLTRLPIKTLHLNRSPMVVSQLKTLRPELAQRWGLDLQQGLMYAQKAASLPDLSALWQALFEPSLAASEIAQPDVDEALYAGLMSDEDRRRLDRLLALDLQEPAWREAGFDDSRLGELVFRYRARNHFETLTAQEQDRWRAHQRARLFSGAPGYPSAEKWFEHIDQLAEAAAERDDDRAEAILGALYDYAETLLESLDH